MVRDQISDIAEILPSQCFRALPLEKIFFKQVLGVYGGREIGSNQGDGCFAETGQINDCAVLIEGQRKDRTEQLSSAASII